MWEWFNNQGLRTFCHLRDERSFDFGNELHSLICHRCSGIYSSFLLFFLAGLLFKYRGYYLKGIKPITVLITGAALLLLSPLQVLIQKMTDQTLLTGGSSRFIIGSLTGLGLLHLYYGLQENPKYKEPKSWILFLFLAVLMAHAVLSHSSMAWVSASSILGLVFVYLVMNHLVIDSMWPKSSTFLKACLVILFVGLEWTLLFWNNVLRHQHG